MIYPQEKKAAQEIIRSFSDGELWVMLLAQMQSGKSSTFKLVAAEMRRRGLIDRVVIFSGNRETDLRDQLLEGHEEFKQSYFEFLRSENLSEKEQSIKDAKRQLEHSLHLEKILYPIMEDWATMALETASLETERILELIRVYEEDLKNAEHALFAGVTEATTFEVQWGQSLKEFVPGGRTLFIWEEAHFGASKNQAVDQFMKQVGIQANGSSVPEGCFVLSVSATPFAELSEKHHLHQGKKIVHLIPGPEYQSVEKLVRSGRVISVPNDRTGMQKMLAKFTHGYALVRASDKKQPVLTTIATAHGCDIKYVDMNHKCDLNEILKQRPERKTVIFLKGMCRMGKQLWKQHVSFVLETPNKSKTDTLLQGLLGRVCGYPKMDGDVKFQFEGDVYIVNLNVTEIETFISLHSGNFTSICERAMNIKKNGARSVRLPTIPLRITGLPEDPDDELYKCILEALDEGRVVNKNNDDRPIQLVREFCANREKVDGTTDEEIKKKDKSFKMHYSGTVFNEAIKGIRAAFTNGVAQSNFGPGAGCASNNDEITVWWHYDKTTKKYSTDAYIIMTLEDLDPMGRARPVPVTNGRDVFGEPSYQDHGGFAATLPTTTKTNIDELEQHLRKFIHISAEHPELYPMPKVTTNGFGKGIYLTQHTMDKMAELINKFDSIGIKLTYKKRSGRRGVDVVLTEIAWTFK